VSSVLVFSEKKELLCEMLSEARRLVDATTSGTVIAVGWGDVESYSMYGADKVYLIAALSEDRPIESVVPAVCSLIQDNNVAAVLMGATKRGKEMAARIAARLDLPCVTECNQITLSADTVTTVRNVYGGVASQTETFVVKDLPVIVTIPPHSYTMEPLSREAVAEDIGNLDAGPVRLIQVRPKPAGTTDIASADTVVCVGRGFEKQEDLALAEDLAEVLGGVVACTRPIAEDFHWMPTDTYVGLSGVKCKPKLYVCVGCSGQIQLVTGIRDSGVIFAIDSDETAPVWEASDYGIVGNLYEIVPALTAGFKKALS
jgi:electron transfer flavoprotein alpha subunit